MPLKTPNVCKEVYIPISNDFASMTIEEYRQATGIDLSQFIFLDELNKHVNIYFPRFTKVYLVNVDSEKAPASYNVVAPNGKNGSDWESGVQDAVTQLLAYDLDSDGMVLNLTIPKSSDFALENILVDTILN